MMMVFLFYLNEVLVITFCLIYLRQRQGIHAGFLVLSAARGRQLVAVELDGLGLEGGGRGGAGDAGLANRVVAAVAVVRVAGGGRDHSPAR